MTPDAQLALIAAIPGYLIAFGTLIGVIATLRQGIQNNKQVKETAAVASEKTEVLIKKTDEIHAVTNAHLTEVTGKWEAGLVEIKGLHGTIVGLQATIQTLIDREGLAKVALKPVEELTIKTEIVTENPLNARLDSLEKLIRESFAEKGRK